MKTLTNIKLPDKLARAFSQKNVSASAVAESRPYQVETLEGVIRLVAGISAYNPEFATDRRSTCVAFSCMRAIVVG